MTPPPDDDRDRLVGLGHLVGTIAHELRNPLTVIESSLFVLSGRVPAEDELARKHLTRIGEQVRAASAIVTSLLDLVHERPVVRATVELGPLADDVVGAAQTRDGIQVRAEGFAGGYACDRVQLRQLLLNLVENAVAASPPGAEVRLSAAREDGCLVLAVEDAGAGVDPAHVPRLFEPLFTTKAGGTGLGLALVRRIAERHGGEVGYAARAGGGARFTVRLPHG